MDLSNSLVNSAKATFYTTGFFSLFLGLGWALTGLPSNATVQSLNSAIPLPGGLLTALLVTGVAVILVGVYNYKENDDTVFGKIVGLVAELLAEIL